MHISRVQIDEGFLDSLDLNFGPGLNVVIGARGTGKTSLIELIRFCLGVKGFTAESAKRSQDHALSILGAGQVTVTLMDGGRVVTVSRTANDPEPRASGQFRSPIIFSQTEVENLGLQPAGRIRLLDSFAAERRRIDDQELSAISEVHSLSTEIASIRNEIEEIERQLVELPSIATQLATLAPKEAQVSALSTSAASKKQALDDLTSKISTHAVSLSSSERFSSTLSRWKMATATAANASADSDSVPGSMPTLVARVQAIRATLTNALQQIGEVEEVVRTDVQRTTNAKLSDESAARELRKEIEALQGGAGAVVSAGQQLRERKARLGSLKEVLDQKTQRLSGLSAGRQSALDRLDDCRQKRFEARQEVAKELNASLGPKIRVNVNRAGQWDTYAGVLADILKGSGLRYNDLSLQIAESVSPRELIELIERNSANELATSALISADRAARVLGQFRQSDLGKLATVLVEDDVALQLLDGTEYKEVAALSTGQRCTVVLPMILQHSDRMLVIDQPEDHIDNAFIADTLIKAIAARSGSGQLLFTTHNANIPVLGGASLVTQFGSDGRRGYVVCSGQLDDPMIVTAITSVMEGGLAAFRKRAEFYNTNERVSYL